MRLGALFSGGKDSTFAIYKVMQMSKEERLKVAKPPSFQVVCLISMISENPESYMFHTPNISLVELQAQAMGLPLVKVVTKGEKENELKELKRAISLAKDRRGIEGVVTGAIDSVYQAERMQRICDRLGLWCFNPLWKKDQLSLLQEIVNSGFMVIISGIFAYPFDKRWLGREIDKQTIRELAGLQEKHKISPSGEGGEIETTVLDAPSFRKRIEVQESEIKYKENSGVFLIKKARLVGK